MAVDKPDYLNCSPDVVGGLIDTVTAATSGHRTLLADPEDLELILDALRVLRPHVAEVEMFAGVLHMKSGCWDEAIYVFRQLGESAPDFVYGKALLASCLAAKGDPAWRQAAAESLAGSPPDAVQAMVDALEAREKVRAA